MSSSMAGCRLSKWYMDCVTDSGDTSIAYSGTVQWGPVRLGYSSVLESTGQRIATRQSLREQDQPEVNDGSISWMAKSLQIDARWQPDSVALRETIFSSESGSVDWHCLLPQARAEFGGRRGLGYVEHIEMTIPPWRLPIENLRWGRFTSASDWAVWIEWEGAFPVRLVYLNGNPVPESLVADERISFENGALLRMDRSLVIRDGPLGTAALGAIPGVDRLFPARLLRIHECKWRSRGQMRRPGGEVVEGWAIHEKVSWPR